MIDSASTPAVKFRLRKIRRSTTGSSSVSSQIRKNPSETAAVIARPTISGEPNQSSSRPLSSISCSEPTHSSSSPSPT
jgi:hypothetical protein